MAFTATVYRATGRALSRRGHRTSLHSSLSTTARRLSSSHEDGDASNSSKHATPTSFATKCASVYSPSGKADRGLAPPIYFASTYTLDDADHGARLHDKKEGAFTDDDGFVYSRWGSPTNEACARQIYALEGADGRQGGGTLLFGSGMSGITSALMSVLKAGDHCVFPYTVYGGTHEFLKEFAVHWGIEVDFVDGAGKHGPEAYKAAFRDNTKVVYCETPANPTCRITDLSGVGAAVDERYGTRQSNPTKRPWVMVDGTFATPYHMRGLDFTGVDVAIQSCTKYLGGHSDLIAGSVTSNSDEFCHGLAKVQKLITAPLNPMDSYLLMRGIRTLDVRMQRHGENALQVARMLETHPLVAATYYPGLESHPDRRGDAGGGGLVSAAFRSGRDSPEDAALMPQTYGGMIAFVIKGEGDVALERAKRVCEGLRVVNLAVSLGSVESLVEHPASMTHAMVPRADRQAGGLDDGLIRISVGIERASDLVADLQASLDRVMEEEEESNNMTA